ncbi:MAG: hypothetical protein ACT4O2_14355 [Beijerinckiaceae bacterium]
MTHAIENAIKRLAELRQQVADIERFIEMYEVFDARTGDDQPDLPRASSNGAPRGNISTRNPYDDVDNYGENYARKRPRRGATPAEIVKITERVIREGGRPLTRGEIVEALERRDVDIPAKDKPRYIGTIVWRNKGVFKNIEGLGYWLSSEPLPTAMGLPLDGEPTATNADEIDRGDGGHLA